jgi:hypothetical protein
MTAQVEKKKQRRRLTFKRIMNKRFGRTSWKCVDSHNFISIYTIFSFQIILFHIFFIDNTIVNSVVVVVVGCRQLDAHKRRKELANGPCNRFFSARSVKKGKNYYYYFSLSLS